MSLGFKNLVIESDSHTNSALRIGDIISLIISLSKDGLAKHGLSLSPYSLWADKVGKVKGLCTLACHFALKIDLCSSH